MRTTLAIDDDIANAMRERARVLDKPFKRVVNDTLRRGLSHAAKEPQPPYRIVLNHSGFVPGVDPLKQSQLNDEIEVEDFLRRESPFVVSAP